MYKCPKHEILKIIRINANPRKSKKPTLIEAKSAPPPSLTQSGIARNNLCGATWLGWIVAAVIFSPIGQVVIGKSWQRQSCSFGVEL